MREEYIKKLRFDASASFFYGKYDNALIECFVKEGRPRIIVDEYPADEEKEPVYFDLAEVLYAGLKSLEKCK